MHHRAAEARERREWRREMTIILQAEHLARCKRLPKIDDLTSDAPRKRKLLAAAAVGSDRPPMTKAEKAAAYHVELAKMQAALAAEKDAGVG